MSVCFGLFKSPKSITILLDEVENGNEENEWGSVDSDAVTVCRNCLMFSGNAEDEMCQECLYRDKVHSLQKECVELLDKISELNRVQECSEKEKSIEMNKLSQKAFEMLDYIKKEQLFAYLDDSSAFIDLLCTLEDTQ